MSRRSLWLFVGVSLAPLVVLGGLCLPPAAGGNGGEPAPQPPDTAKSEYVLFAHLDVKAIRDGALFTELKQAVAKEGVTKLWDMVEAEESRDLGFKPTDLDSVTVCVTEVPPRAEGKVVLIFASSKPIDKAAAFHLGPDAKPDARGFYKSQDQLLHFPDDKTAVILHPDLAQKYLDGYAKDRVAWPFTKDLTAAAAGHTAVAVVNVQKLPLQELRGNAVEGFEPLLATRTVTVAVDLKGKELSVAGRATYPTPADAAKAKGTVQKIVALAADEVGSYTKLTPDRSNRLLALDAFKPLIASLHRAIKESKVEAVGSDVTLAGGYKADFEVPKLVADVVKQAREHAPRIAQQNNLKQLALSMHSYASNFNDRMPVYGIGPDGALLKKADEKPLLSWRVALLPFLEEGALYKQFKLDEPWDSENNKKLIEKMPKVYAAVAKPGKPGYTHLQMVVGPQAMPPPFADLKSTFRDGTSNTVMIVEAADPVIWTKPDDLMLPGKEPPKDFRKKFGGQFPNGFYVAMWDGSTRFVAGTVSDRTLGQALTPAGDEIIGADW